MFFQIKFVYLIKTENMNEIWKTIEGYPDYMISSMGRVKSLKRVDYYGRHRKEKILKLNKNRDGYLIVH